MEKYLFGKAKKGEIRFIKTRLDWGNKHSEFLVISFGYERKTLSRIFYDNKYREDKIDKQNTINYYKIKLKKAMEGINDIGIYNTKDDVEYFTNIINFIS